MFIYFFIYRHFQSQIKKKLNVTIKYKVNETTNNATSAHIYKNIDVDSFTELLLTRELIFLKDLSWLGGDVNIERTYVSYGSFLRN